MGVNIQRHGEHSAHHTGELVSDAVLIEVASTRRDGHGGGSDTTPVLGQRREDRTTDDGEQDHEDHGNDQGVDQEHERDGHAATVDAHNDDTRFFLDEIDATPASGSTRAPLPGSEV